MSNRPRVLALCLLALFGGAVALNQWYQYAAETKPALNADETAVLAEKLLKSQMTYGAIDQSVLKVDAGQQAAMQTRVDVSAAVSPRAFAGARGAATASAGARQTAKSGNSGVANTSVSESLTAETSTLTGMRGQKTRWEKFEFDREAALASVAPIGMVASGFAGGSNFSPWAITGGSSGGAQAFNWPTSLEQSVASLSGLVSQSSAETPAEVSAPAKVEPDDTATQKTSVVQSSVDVDEPGNWSLMAIGLLMLLVWRQRQFAIRAN